METQFTQIAHIPLGSFPEGHINPVITISGKKVENVRENDKEVEDNSSDKKVEIEENPPTSPENEVVEEVEKETPYVASPSYKPSISFPQRFMEANVRAQPKSYAEILEKTHINVSLTKVLYKKRKLEDRETEEIIDVKRGMLAFEAEDKGLKPNSNNRYLG